jgi:ATP-binding protein involved in chromosome partitioning
MSASQLQGNLDWVKISRNLKRIKYKIIVMSGKGGVGKTTVAVNLAFSLSMRSTDVGLLDIDITGPNVPKMLGCEEHKISTENGMMQPVIVPPRIKIMSMAFLINRDQAVVWRGPMKMKAIAQFIKDVDWGDLDFLVVDLPPGSGDEALSIAQQVPDADGVIIVTTPQDVSLLDAQKSISFARQLNVPIIGIVENMSGLICPHCHGEVDIYKRGGGERLAKQFGVPYLGAVPFDPSIVKDGDAGVPFIMNHRESPSAKAFEHVVCTALDFVIKQGGHKARDFKYEDEAVEAQRRGVVFARFIKEEKDVPKQILSVQTDGGQDAGPIKRSMKIGDVVAKFPTTVPVFKKYGLGCVGCAVNSFENIDQGARAHMKDVNALMRELNEQVAATPKA